MVICTVVLIDISAVAQWCRKLEGHSTEKALDLVTLSILRVVLAQAFSQHYGHIPSVQFGWRIYDGREGYGSTPRELERKLGARNSGQGKYFEDLGESLFSLFRESLANGLQQFQKKLTHSHEERQLSCYDILSYSIQEVQNEYNWQDFGGALSVSRTNNRIVIFSRCPWNLDQLGSFVRPSNLDSPVNERCVSMMRDMLNSLSKPSVKFSHSQLDTPNFLWMDSLLFEEIGLNKVTESKRIHAVFSSTKKWSILPVEQLLCATTLFPVDCFNTLLQSKSEEFACTGMGDIKQTVEIFSNSTAKKRTLFGSAVATWFENEFWVKNIPGCGTPGTDDTTTVDCQAINRSNESENLVTQGGTSRRTRSQMRNPSRAEATTVAFHGLKLKEVIMRCDLPVGSMESIVGLLSTENSTDNGCLPLLFSKLASKHLCAVVQWQNAADMTVEAYVVPATKTVCLVVALLRDQNKDKRSKPNKDSFQETQKGAPSIEKSPEERNLVTDAPLPLAFGGLHSLPICNWRISQQSASPACQSYRQSSVSSTPSANPLRDGRVEGFLTAKRIAEALLVEAQRNATEAPLSPSTLDADVARYFQLSKSVSDALNSTVKNLNSNTRESHSRESGGSGAGFSSDWYARERERLQALVRKGQRNNSSCTPVAKRNQEPLKFDIDDIVFPGRKAPASSRRVSPNSASSAVGITLADMSSELQSLLLEHPGSQATVHSIIRKANHELRTLGCQLGEKSTLTKVVMDLLKKKLLDGNQVENGKYDSEEMRGRMYQIQTLLRLELASCAKPIRDPPSKRTKRAIFELLQKFSFSIAASTNDSGGNGQQCFRQFVDSAIVSYYVTHLPKTVNSVYMRFFEEELPTTVTKEEIPVTVGETRKSKPSEATIGEPNKSSIHEVTSNPKHPYVHGRKRHFVEKEASTLRKRAKAVESGAGSALVAQKPAKEGKTSSKSSALDQLRRLSGSSIVASRRTNSLVRNPGKKLVMNHFTSALSNPGVLFRQVQRRARPNQLSKSAKKASTTGFNEAVSDRSQSLQSPVVKASSTQSGYDSSPALFRSPQRLTERISSGYVVQETPKGGSAQVDGVSGSSVVFPTPSRGIVDESPTLFASPSRRQMLNSSTIVEASPQLNFGKTSRKLALHFED